jgi:hypothetical protein
VGHVNGEANRFPTLCVAMPVSDDVADQVGTIHTLSELNLNVIAALAPHTVQVGIDWCIHLSFYELAFLDQGRDLWAFNDDVEDAAKAATIAPAGSRG